MELTSEHEELKRSAIKFVDTEINPYVDQWEEDEIFPAHEVLITRTVLFLMKHWQV